MSESFEFKINQDDSAPMGGTELIYNRVMEYIPEELQEEFVIIPQRVRESHLNDARKKILWLHDLPEDPESDHLRSEENRKQFAKFVPMHIKKYSMDNSEDLAKESASSGRYIRSTSFTNSKLFTAFGTEWLRSKSFAGLRMSQKNFVVVRKEIVNRG